MIKHKQMTNTVEGDENCIVGNEWEDARPCYTHKGGDVCAKLIYAVLCKYNPAISANDVNNDLKRLEKDSFLFNTMVDIRQRMPVAVFNKEQVNYIFNVNSRSDKIVFNRQIKNAIKKLSKETVTINNTENSIAIYGIFTRLEYHGDDDEHTLIAEFNYNLLPFVLDLRGKIYTTIPLNDIRLLSSDYSIKILTFCMRYDKNKHDEFNFTREVVPSKLREILNVSDSYRVNNFNSKILDKCTEEITKKTSWNVKWEGKYNGRKITKYIFFVTAKNQPEKKEYADTIKGIGIDTSLINNENKEIVLYLCKKGVNRKQIFDTYHSCGIAYIKYLTSGVDNYYNKKTSKDESYYLDGDYYDKLTNTKINYGAIWQGARKSWLNYDAWAKEHPEEVNAEKTKREEAAKKKSLDDARTAAEKEAAAKRDAFRKYTPAFKDLSDDVIDQMLNTYTAAKNKNVEAEEAEKQKKANENNNNEEKAVKEIVVDSFARANFDVAALSLSPFKDFFFDEQKRLGFDDFAEFVQYVRKRFINSM